MNSQVIGIMLVKNEDVFVERAILNVLDFCDAIIVADHQSEDGTSRIVRQMATVNHKIKYHSIARSSESHDLIAGYVNTNTWIFGVDGDEVYDPEGLRLFRTRLDSGEFDKWWQIFGNVIHCVQIDAVSGMVRGYQTPPCRSMTKLFNFNAISSWDGEINERLHDGNVVFKNGYDISMRLALYNENPWEKSAFRCLHMCFCQRSSLQINKGDVYVRRNLVEESHKGLRVLLRRVFERMTGRVSPSAAKMKSYMSGPLVSVSCARFF